MQFHPDDLSELEELTEEHLGFSALSEGLGFSKNAKKNLAQKSSGVEGVKEEKVQKPSYSGTGAVSAGPARPAPAMYQPNRAFQAAPVNKSTTSTSVLAEPAAPRWMRVSAFLLDALMIGLPLVAAWAISFGSDSIQIFSEDPVPPMVLFGVVFAAYFLLSESFGGQSLGKMILGLRVVEDDKYEKPTGLRHAVVRIVLFAVGMVCLGLGFFASFWDSKRRPWHDRYSGSIVRRKA